MCAMRPIPSDGSTDPRTGIGESRGPPVQVMLRVRTEADLMLLTARRRPVETRRVGVLCHRKRGVEADAAGVDPVAAADVGWIPRSRVREHLRRYRVDVDDRLSVTRERVDRCHVEAAQRAGGI